MKNFLNILNKKKKDSDFVFFNLKGRQITLFYHAQYSWTCLLKIVSSLIIAFKAFSFLFFFFTSDFEVAFSSFFRGIPMLKKGTYLRDILENFNFKSPNLTLVVQGICFFYLKKKYFSQGLCLLNLKFFPFCFDI